MKCIDGFILKDNGTSCVSNSSYPNCSALDANNVCISCSTGYYLIFGQCVKGTIDKCTVYRNDSNDQQCIECSTGFRPALNFKSCIPGNLAFCNIYDNTPNTSCKQCVGGGASFKYDNGQQQNFCFPQQLDLNCESLTTPSANQKVTQLQCAQCKPGFYPSTDTTQFNVNACITTEIRIDKCLQYSFTGDFFSSNFKCTLCEDNYYVDQFGYKCEARTVSITNCKTMNPLNQKCAVCLDNYFLSQSQSECVKFPTGVKNCFYYSDDVTCTQCSAGYYLSSNFCLAVEGTAVINQCQFYNANKECIACNTNFVLVSGQCQAPTAKNCLTFASITECKTCPSKYYLVKDTTNNTTNCVLKDISFCDVLDQSTGKCSQCKTQYFIDTDGNCKLASQFIQNCVIQKSNDTCLQCAEGTFVSGDEKSCLIQGAGVLNKFTNCLYLKYDNTKNCHICQDGYYFNNGVCTVCTAGDGCASCDYRTPSVCLMCKSGYHQTDVNSTCVKSPIPEFPKLQGTTTSLLSSSYHRISAFIGMMTAMVHLLF